jgi:hypothetical protein
LGGVALGGSQAADGGVDGVDVEESCVEDGGAVDDLDDCCGGGLGGAAALGVEGWVLDTSVGDGEGDSGEIAAGGATGSARESAIGSRPAPALIA